MLKAIITQLTDVDEGFRSHYRAGTAAENMDGKFILDVEAFEGFGLENVNGLKTALSTERSALQAEKQKTKDFEGLDPVEAKNAVAKMKDLGTLDPKKDLDRLVQEKLDAQLTQINDLQSKELGKRDTAIAARDELLKSTFQREAAVKEIAAAKGDVDLLLPHVLPSIAFDLEEGENGALTPKTRVVDEKGNTKIGSSAGSNMTIAEHVAEMKKSDKFSKLFDGSGHDGTKDDGTRKPTSQTGKKISEMTRKEKSGLIGELGQQAYNERVNQERAAAE
jgi:hypothetical protein